MAPEAVRQAVGGGCRSGTGRLVLVTNAIEAGTWRWGDSGWAQAGRPGGGGYPPPSNASLTPPPPGCYPPPSIRFLSELSRNQLHPCLTQ